MASGMTSPRKDQITQWAQGAVQIRLKLELLFTPPEEGQGRGETSTRGSSFDMRSRLQGLGGADGV